MNKKTKAGKRIMNGKVIPFPERKERRVVSGFSRGWMNFIRANNYDPNADINIPLFMKPVKYIFFVNYDEEVYTTHIHVDNPIDKEEIMRILNENLTLIVEKVIKKQVDIDDLIISDAQGRVEFSFNSVCSSQLAKYL